MAPEVRVPGVGVHQVDAVDRRRHRQVDGHRLERRGARGRAGEHLPGAVCAGHQRRVARRAEAVHPELEAARELAREVLDMDAGAAVDVGGKLAREQRDLHTGSSMTCRLPMTTIPF